MITNLERSKLITRYPSLKVCENSIVEAINSLIKSFQSGGKLITFGNGGSACDAEHMCGELQKGFLSKRELNQGTKDLFNKIDPQISISLQHGLPAISLSTQFATQSAFANDVDPSYCFAQQVFILANSNDVVFGISTSGNSKNVVNALKVAKAKGVPSIALTGQSANQCELFADITIKTPGDSVHEIQELHLPIYHCICLEIESFFWPS